MSNSSIFPKVLYGIKCPEISKGLKRTYHKNMEILEFRYDFYETRFAKAAYKYKQTHIHKFKNGKFERTKTSSAAFHLYADSKILSEPVQRLYDSRRTGKHNELLVFDSFELAYISKTYLIKDMKNEYEHELEKLRTLMIKNVPDIEQHIKMIKETYPEYMI